MCQLLSQIKLTLKWAFRDRIFYAVIGVGLFILFLVPIFSSFSMRQVQELSITLALSFNAFFLLVMAILLGSVSFWREIDRRYAHSVLSLPVSRLVFILGKFFGISIFLLICTLILGLISSFLILLATSTYPSDIHINWKNILVAMLSDYIKCLLVVSFAIFFSTVSTSFYLPFFSTIAIYFSGSATQQVYDYVSGKYGEDLSGFSIIVSKLLYYLLPNLSVLDYKLYAIYSLDIDFNRIFIAFLYSLIYISIVVVFSISTFSRRQFS